MDFYKIKERSSKKGAMEIYPEFIVTRSKDLMVRGKSFYAMWNPNTCLWTTDEYDVQSTIDNDLRTYRDRLPVGEEEKVSVKYTRDFSSSSWLSFRNYLSHISDNYHLLDEKITFADTEVSKSDYVSRRLPYSLMEGDHSAFDEMMETLYDEDEREKILWAIGSIVSGDSKRIQKFAVMYGAPGSGKGTVIDIIQKLFGDYCVSFNAKDLVSNRDNFATEIFRTNPLVCVDPDAKLSKIDDNTTLNTIVSHEVMVMKEKYKPAYNGRANAFLFLGSNDPVKITDAKSGIIRRLIDISPSGRTVPHERYFELMSRIDFELGAIADYCLKFYKARGKHYYDGYKPINMMFKTDEFFNFVEDSYFVFKEKDGISLTNAYAMYKTYCDESGASYKLQRYKFREALKDYFRNFDDIYRTDEGRQVRSWYSGFMTEKFDRKQQKPKERSIDIPEWLNLNQKVSLLDEMLSDCFAQYATEKGIPSKSWSRVTTTLKDLDTSLVHYIRVPLSLICVDFDLKNEKGEKDRLLNLQAATSWPKTYAEFSKSGQGLHLYYIYDGDPTKLQSVYAPGIEIKVFQGKSSLRRKVGLCNDIPVSHLSSGLPVKEEKKMLNFQAVQSERGLRDMIERNIRKEIHPGTKPSIDFIDKILSDAYESGLHYDISDMQPKIISFASHSSHQAEYCLTKVAKMKFKSDDILDEEEAVLPYRDDRLVFFDVEVFPNLVLINWKFQGTDKCVRMINPTSEDVEDLFKLKLVGFNCRRYDNHILYAIYLGKTTLEIFDISQRIVSGSRNAMFSEAYNISYTDVYDFCSKKQSLKKWEIELGFHHQELGLPWDQPVPEERWTEVAEYCDNDVFATEAVFNDRQADWTARQILADIAGMTVNDTTNSLTTRIIFGQNRHPQDAFNYRQMGDEFYKSFEPIDIPGVNTEYTVFDSQNRPIFPGYVFENGKSMYRGEDVGLGGYVYAEPGVYHHVALLDIASMHPSSIVAENLFGTEYTKRFKDILQARIFIKHKDYQSAGALFDGKLSGYLNDENQAKALAGALKIAINSVYGLTSATFDNPFRDIRNKDNIVAKRGALFMVNLKHEVQARGYKVAHIKTDSIKIPEADEKIIQFVIDYGKLYGYSFEHEATYDRMCLVNDAVYIARYSKDSFNEHPGEWTATGTQFQVPYVFKRLFSKESIEFDDLCETKTVTSALYLDMNEDLPDDSLLVKELDKLLKKEDWTEEEQGRMDAIADEIAKCHNYIFVGKAGRFCPVKKGCGGGLLMREKDGKYYAATGTKGYRWKESEIVRDLHLEDQIDHGYFESLAEEAKKAVEVYEDFDFFVDGEYPEKDICRAMDPTPPWQNPCGNMQYETCMDCPHWKRSEGADNVDELYRCDLNYEVSI